MKPRGLYRYVGLWLALLLGGCGLKGGTPVADVATVTAVLPSATVGSTVTPWPSTTPTPPMPVEMERMVEQMEDASCRLPCYLGIRPGETRVERAKEILESMGGKLLGEFQKEGYILYLYSLSHSYQWHSDYASIDLIVVEGVVERMEVSVQLALPCRDRGACEVWAKWYSVRGIFEQLGEPARFFILPDVPNRYIMMAMTYPESGVAIDLGHPLCQGSKVYTGRLPGLWQAHLWLNDEEYARQVFAGGIWPNLDIPSHGQRVEELLGMDEALFYKTVLEDEDFYFEIEGVALPPGE